MAKFFVLAGMTQLATAHMGLTLNGIGNSRDSRIGDAFRNPTGAYCHGQGGPFAAAQKTVEAGTRITARTTGGAGHGGGACAMYLSTHPDLSSMYKIGDFNDCTKRGNANVFSFEASKVWPVECSEPMGCRVVWIWTPANSGTCETYTNCWDIRVTGTTGGMKSLAPMIKWRPACRRPKGGRSGMMGPYVGPNPNYDVSGLASAKLQDWHFAEEGATTCDIGITATQGECGIATGKAAVVEGTTASVNPVSVGPGSDACSAWGTVPQGCTGQATTNHPHFRKTPNSGLCPAGGYRLVCSTPKAILPDDPSAIGGPVVVDAPIECANCGTEEACFATGLNETYVTVEGDGLDTILTMFDFEDGGEQLHLLNKDVVGDSPRARFKQMFTAGQEIALPQGHCESVFDGVMESDCIYNCQLMSPGYAPQAVSGAMIIAIALQYVYFTA